MAMKRVNRKRVIRASGFTLLELLVVMVILAFAVAVAGPAGSRMLDTMQYRSAVKDLVSSLSATRYAAITSGVIQDVEIRPVSRQILIDGKVKELSEQISLEVIAAAELNRNGVGLIRFYPDGGSSGGTIELTRGTTGSGVMIQVDWLLGKISQQRIDNF